MMIKEESITSQASVSLLEELSNALEKITGNSGLGSFQTEKMENPRAVFLVAYEGNYAVGCGAIQELSPNTAEMKRMYARTPGKGVGRAVLQKLEEKAKSYGYRRIVLETHKINQTAVDFYLGNGYRTCENYGKYAGRDEAVCFEKQLGDSIRPELTGQLEETTFRSFYYLKEELVEFCRKKGLSTSGGKLELTERIAHYLSTGEVLAPSKKRTVRTQVGTITRETLIEPDFVCSEKHRAFFKAEIGPGFSFPVAFQKWLKSNTGKTYQEAIEAYGQILEAKKQNKTTIDRQFEYNTYIRDFFADNKGRPLEEAIRCWNYKKSIPGHNRYEKSDLDELQR